MGEPPEAKAQTFFSQANPSTQATPTPKKHATMKFDLKPSVHLSGTGKDDVSAGVTARFDHNDLSVQVRASDQGLRGNGSLTDGLVVSARKDGHFTFAYDVGHDAPAFHFLSNARVANKDLRLKYTHEVKGKANHLQARFDVDDKSLSLHYDAHANTGSVEWTNHSLGGPGALRVSATSSLSDNGLKQMPNISASKVFDLEL